VRLFRCEVRDHINYRKNDRWPSYRFYSALQRQKSPMRYIYETLGALRFSSFATQSKAKRTSHLAARTSEFDPGCVKTCAHEKRAELFSLLSCPDNRRQRFCFSN